MFAYNKVVHIINLDVMKLYFWYYSNWIYLS